MLLALKLKKRINRFPRDTYTYDIKSSLTSLVQSQSNEEYINQRL